MTQTVLLGDLVNIKHGYAFKGEFFVDQPTKNVLVTPGNFEVGGGFRAAKLKYYQGPIDESYVLKPKDLVITMTDLSKAADTLGYSALIPSGKNKYLHNQRIGLVTIKNDSISKDYLYWVLRSREYREWVIAGATGSTVKHTSPSKILGYRFKMPGLETQKNIADILGTIDEKIELNRKMNETLEQMGQALFRHYFIDNPNTDEWEDGVIADLGRVVTGKTPSKTKDEYYGDSVMFLKVPDMHDQSIIIKTQDNLSRTGADSQSKKYLSRWSTCVSCIATVGVISLAGAKLQTNQQINSVIPKSDVYTFYNFFLLKSKTELLQTMASGGSTTPNLNKGQFEKIKIKLPDMSTLTDFHARARPIFNLIDSQTREIQTLTTLRDTLLPRLISGKVIL